jgi:1-deoxy-D-xylulose-5-phosphate synthase
VAEAERDERVVAITAAMPAGTGLTRFAERFPDRFFDVGIAEQHAVGLAAGLAHGGQVPVVAIYSTFLQRAYDQVIMDAVLQGLHVVFCLDRAGLVGEDGPTHHGVFDLTYLRAIPGLQVMAPADEAELVHMLRTAIEADGPVAIRYPRGSGRGVAMPSEPQVLAPGVSERRRDGADVALLAVGRMVGVAQDAAELLAERGVDAGVVNMRWVKPVDRNAILEAAGTALIVTLEENTGEGGFGAAVMEVLADADVTAPVLRIAVPDCFVTHGKTEVLLEEIGLTSGQVCERVLSRLAETAEAKGVAADGSAQARRRAR